MPYVNFKKLKEQVPLVAVLEHYDLLSTLEETAQGYEGTCPFCGSDAFKANTAKNAWFCFGECKEKEEHNGGNILDFVARKEGVSIKTAALRISKWDSADEEDTEEQEVRNRTSKVHEDETEGQGSDTKPSPEPQTPLTEAPVMPGSLFSTNPPLTFKLRHLDHVHPYLTETLGFQTETMEQFGVGYFAGKGMMHNRIVVPIHNKDGSLVAYAGASLEDGTYKYPEMFVREHELFNLYRAQAVAESHKPVILVTDYFDVFRLYEAGYRFVVALPTEKLSLHQVSYLLDLVGEGGMVSVFVSHAFDRTVELMNVLIGLFHVRLIRPEGTKKVSELSVEEIHSQRFRKRPFGQVSSLLP